SLQCLSRSSLIEGREQIVQRFRQCRMSKNSVSQDSIGNLTHHCHLQYSHDLAAFNTEDSTTENLTCIGIYHRFHEPPSLIQLECTGYVIHGHFSDLNIAT